MEWSGNIISKAQSILYAGGLAMVGQIATLIHNHLEGKAASIRHWIMSLALAFIIGRTVKDFIPVDSTYKDAMLIISGVVAHPVYSLLEKLGIKILKKETKL